jgi:hypothetical protein
MKNVEKITDSSEVQGELVGDRKDPSILELDQYKSTRDPSINSG